MGTFTFSKELLGNCIFSVGGKLEDTSGSFVGTCCCESALDELLVEATALVCLKLAKRQDLEHEPPTKAQKL